jgi:hypothetical protein
MRLPEVRPKRSEVEGGAEPNEALFTPRRRKARGPIPHDVRDESVLRTNTPLARPSAVRSPHKWGDKQVVPTKRRR